VARAPRLLILGYALLAIAWMVGNAPFAAPDEEAHYARALGIAQGRLLGPRAPLSAPLPDPLQSHWAQDQARAQRIPAGLSPVGFTCPGPRSSQPASCQDAAHAPAVPTVLVSTAGNFQPLPYLLPALAAPLGSHPPGALRLGRAASLLPCLLLLAAGLLALGAGDGLAQLGALAVLTPQVVFLTASLTGSGLEAAASFALIAGLLALSRGRQPDDRRLRAQWVLVGVAGTVLALTRTLGVAWVLLDGAGVVLVLGPRPLIVAARAAPAAALAAVAATLVALVVNRTWEAAHGVHIRLSAVPSGAALRATGHHLGDLWWGAIARFDALELRPPQPLPALWAVGVLALLVLGARLAGRRTGGRLLLLAGAVAVCVVWLAAQIIERSGFSLQGRDVLAGLILPPMVAGELVHRHRDRCSRVVRRGLLPSVAALAALAQLFCFLFDARRFAVGPRGSVLFALHPDWTPPAGWWPWLGLAAAGAILLATGGARRSPLAA